MPVRKIPSAWFASLPSMHEIVPVASKTSFYVDETRSAVDLNPGDIFAELHLIDGRLKICPTTNLPLDVEEVFLCHDGQPNVVRLPTSLVHKFVKLTWTDRLSSPSRELSKLVTWVSRREKFSNAVALQTLVFSSRTTFNRLPILERSVTTWVSFSVERI